MCELMRWIYEIRIDAGSVMGQLHLKFEDIILE